MAAPALTKSMIKMPLRPMGTIKAPASMGARMREAGPAISSMPLARAYCPLGIIMVIAAEKAGHWKPLKIPPIVAVT